MSVSGDSASGRPYGVRRHTSELFSLELDGEVEMEPEWARILQRRMKSNEKLQEACRVHDKELQQMYTNLPKPFHSSKISYPKSCTMSKMSMTALDDLSSDCLPLPMTLPKGMQKKMVNANAAEQHDDVEDSTRLEDKYTIVSECPTKHDDVASHECLKLDSGTGLMEFIDPDPRILYLNKYSSRCIRAHVKGPELMSSQPEIGLHSIKWWGIKDNKGLLQSHISQKRHEVERGNIYQTARKQVKSKQEKETSYEKLKPKIPHNRRSPHRRESRDVKTHKHTLDNKSSRHHVTRNHDRERDPSREHLENKARRTNEKSNGGGSLHVTHSIGRRHNRGSRKRSRSRGRSRSRSRSRSPHRYHSRDSSRRVRSRSSRDRHERDSFRYHSKSSVNKR